MFMRGTKVRKDILIHASVAVIFLVAILLTFRHKRTDFLSDPEITGSLANFSSPRSRGPLVPNYLHFILLDNANNISFTHFLCILAAMKNQHPEVIYFHSNTGELRGVYWDQLKRIPEFRRVARVKATQIPDAILDQPLTESIRVFYGIGILKILLLRKYGGIYLDTNTYITKDLTKFRNAELTLDAGRGMNLGSQISLAQEDGRFLKVWHNLYRKLYESRSWYYFSQNPMDWILEGHPELCRRLPEIGEIQFYDKSSGRFRESTPFWKSFYLFQLPRDLEYYELKESESESSVFDFHVSEENARKYGIPLSEMIEEVSIYAKHNTDVG